MLASGAKPPALRSTFPPANAGVARRAPTGQRTSVTGNRTILSGPGTTQNASASLKQDSFPFTCGENAAPIETDLPTRRLLRNGASALSDIELIAILLQGNGLTPAAAIATASSLLHTAGSTDRLLSWTPADYQSIAGVGHFKATQLTAAAELGRRMLTTPITATPLLNRADLVYAYMAPIVAGLEIEKFFVLSLNRKNRLLNLTAITSGTATAALAHPREVLRTCIRYNATAYIACHNHPSGEPSPSAPDIAVTRQLREASRATDIELIDHVILGHPAHDPQNRGYYSFREAGLL